MTLRYCTIPLGAVVEDITEDDENGVYLHVYVRDIYENFISPKESTRINKKLNERFLHEVENDERFHTNCVGCKW